MASERTSLGTKVFLALVVIGLGAAGGGAMKTYLEKSRQGQALEERGVVTDADITSVIEVTGRRTATYHRLTVSYDPSGPRPVQVAEVLDCSGARYESGMRIVSVVYLPDDPDVIRLESCR